MCVVSMIGDHYHYKWGPLIPSPSPYNNPNPPIQDLLGPKDNQYEFDLLKKEVEEMKILLKKAIKYDEDHNEPHCEIEEKIATLKKIAEYVGISLDDVFKK